MTLRARAAQGRAMPPGSVSRGRSSKGGSDSGRSSSTTRARRASAGRIAFTIRPGGPRDAPVILGLIRGLAEYERLAHQVEATIGRIRHHGFGRRRYFETLICRRQGRPVGFALYFFTYSTFLARPSLYLEDLFVL